MSKEKLVTKELIFRDPVVEKVVDNFILRSEVGFKKYGQSLESERLSGVKGLYEYINDVQEELMDAVLYLQSVKDCLKEQ